MISKGSVNQVAETSNQKFTPMHLSSWVRGVLRDPLSKSALIVHEDCLESEYGRKYPVVDGIYDLRLLTTQYGHGVRQWAACQTEYENFAARERKNRRRSDYRSEQRGV